MLDELIKYDSNFDEAGFKSYIDNIFVKLFTSVMTDSLDDVKHFLSSEVRETYQKKIDDLNHQNLIQMYDELNVKTSSISNVEITDNSFIITVSLTARYLDYLLRKDTGSFVSGNVNNRVCKDYLLVFTKKRQTLQQGIVRKCPGCGASLSVNTSGVCEYCGTTYNLADYDYILTSIKEC